MMLLLSTGRATVCGPKKWKPTAKRVWARGQVPPLPRILFFLVFFNRDDDCAGCRWAGWTQTKTQTLIIWVDESDCTLPSLLWLQRSENLIKLTLNYSYTLLVQRHIHEGVATVLSLTVLLSPLLIFQKKHNYKLLSCSNEHFNAISRKTKC